MKGPWISGLFAFCALTLSPPTARAGPVTFEFSGEVTRVDDPDNLLLGTVLVGDPFLGTYTFEATTPDADPHTRRGMYTGAITGVTAVVGAAELSGPRLSGLNSIQIEDGFASPTRDSYVIRVPVDAAGVPLDFLLALFDDSGQAFGDDLLSSHPPRLSAFDTAVISIFDRSERLELFVDGSVRTLVPEPATIALLAIGVMFASRRTVRTSSERRSRRRALVAAILAAMPPLCGQVVHAADCNGNGISDSLELAECKLDVVYLIDTSSSMTSGVVQNVCSDIRDARNALLSLHS